MWERRRLLGPDSPIKITKQAGLPRSNKHLITMKKKKQSYIAAVKTVDRALELKQFGKLISTRPTRIHRSKKVYSRKNLGKLRNLEDLE